MDAHLDGRVHAQLGLDCAPRSRRALNLLVIDASAALYASAGPSGLSELTGYDVVAPPLLWSEVTSTLRQRSFRNEISVELAERTLAALVESPIERRAPPELYRAAFTLAARLGWAKTYDAEYVALAQLLACPLLTADARLRRGAARVVNTLAPGELTAR